MMILLVLLLFEFVSIAIYVVLSTQKAFGEILPDWEGNWDDRPFYLLIAAVFTGWTLAPYFVWLMWQWIKKKKKEE